MVWLPGSSSELADAVPTTNTSAMSSNPIIAAIKACLQARRMMSPPGHRIEGKAYSGWSLRWFDFLRNRVR
jgi:hypothetical protein